MDNISQIVLEEVDWMKKNGDEGRRITKKSSSPTSPFSISSFFGNIVFLPKGWFSLDAVWKRFCVVNY